ncbi:MAG: non-canonical purine NTP pyrophosphatase, partial [Myxococcota bacterium]|nr:non-canonical purine NTP pyrophosphatase [Myxococcota bacterium]
MQIILASNNKGKQKELQQILQENPFTFHTLSEYAQIPDPPETQKTFRGNALQKARFVYGFTGGIVIADDSGLCVDALNGAPGVHSKRYTPEATAESNNKKL